jgi:hypothetical protein
LVCGAALLRCCAVLHCCAALLRCCAVLHCCAALLRCCAVLHCVTVVGPVLELQPSRYTTGLNPTAYTVRLHFEGPRW